MRDTKASEIDNLTDALFIRLHTQANRAGMSGKHRDGLNELGAFIRRAAAFEILDAEPLRSKRQIIGKIDKGL